METYDKTHSHHMKLCSVFSVQNSMFKIMEFYQPILHVYTFAYIYMSFNRFKLHDLDATLLYLSYLIQMNPWRKIVMIQWWNDILWMILMKPLTDANFNYSFFSAEHLQSIQFTNVQSSARRN